MDENLYQVSVGDEGGSVMDFPRDIVCNIVMLTGSPCCIKVQSKYLPKVINESENPIKEASRYGVRAKAWVPNMSIILTEDFENRTEAT